MCAADRRSTRARDPQLAVVKLGVVAGAQASEVRGLVLAAKNLKLDVVNVEIELRAASRYTALETIACEHVLAHTLRDGRECSRWNSGFEVAEISRVASRAFGGGRWLFDLAPVDY